MGTALTIYCVDGNELRFEDARNIRVREEDVAGGPVLRFTFRAEDASAASRLVEASAVIRLYAIAGYSLEV